jgi:hypothetical protein
MLFLSCHLSCCHLLSLYLSHHLVSFKIYDLDGDGVISTKDLTKVVADTMREQDVVIHKGTYYLGPWTLLFAEQHGI